jgi:riboflavin synthase
MFTGLIREVGSVERIDRGSDGARLAISAELAAELEPGDSVAVSGVCLTATRLGDGGFEADAMNQTLELTSLGALGPGDRVNLEPALRASDRMGGHVVQGHVDATATVAEVRRDGFARWLRIELPTAIERYVVEHGSIAIDGVSLTVARLEPGAAEVSLIPETLQRTTLGDRSPGERVNVEVDVIARYAERLIRGLQPSEGS